MRPRDRAVREGSEESEKSRSVEELPSHFSPFSQPFEGTYLGLIQSLRDAALGPLAHTGAEGFGEDLVDGVVRDQRTRPVAWLIYSNLLRRDLWICADQDTAAEIAAESPELPTLTIDEVVHLRGKPPELISAILEVKIQFPTARLRA